MRAEATGPGIADFWNAVRGDDAAAVRRLLKDPQIKGQVNAPAGPFDSPAILHARSREMLDALLGGGAEINGRSRWWAGSFGILDVAPPELAEYAIGRGAVVDVHAAARLGKVDRLRELVESDAEQVHARGGDGQTPLHFAATVEVAGFLLEHGARIDARDIDHESTPAQYMVRDRAEVARYLVQRGCATDLLMASALGEVELVRKHLDAQPDSIRMQVSQEWFPRQNPRSGGTIYQWTLGSMATPHQVAREFGHEAVLALLMERSPADVKLLAACGMGDRKAAETLVKEQPGLVKAMAGAFAGGVADAARNNNLAAVGLMLAAGMGVEGRGQHGGTPLHWAAFHGNVEMVKLILAAGAPLEALDADFKSTPVGWAMHGSEHGWAGSAGDYAATVDAILKAGATAPARLGGSQAVQQVLKGHGVTSG